MKNLLKFVSILACAAALIVGWMCLHISCSKKENQISNYELLHCLNCPKGTISEQPNYDSLQILKLETNKDCLITEFRQLEMNDSMIFLLDLNESLYAFNKNGKFISRIGEKGNGPGEYNRINTFFIDNKNGNIIIVDEVKSALITYDFTGKFISTVHLPMENIRNSSRALLLDNGYLMLNNMINPEDNMAYSIVDLHSGRLKGKYFPYDPIRLNNSFYTFSNHPMVKFEDEIHFIMPLSDTIYNYSKSSFSTKYIVEGLQKVASKEQIKQPLSSYSSEIFRLGQDGYFTGFTALFETQNKILLEYKEQGIILGFFLFDKQTKEGNQYLYTVAEFIKEVPFFRIVYSLPDDQFVGIANPVELLRIKNSLDVNNLYVKQLKEVIENTNEDDNPILFIYKFDK